jgi:hypothetical protein
MSVGVAVIIAVILLAGMAIVTSLAFADSN